MTYKETIEALSLKGLRAAPSQVLGAVRLVPLIRESPIRNLRLAATNYFVTERPVASGERVTYYSYIPYGLIVSWSENGDPVAAIQTDLAKKGKGFQTRDFELGPHRRMVRKTADQRLRMLPLHFAMEGYLRLFFNGPDIAWSDYTKLVLAEGLSPRSTHSIPGSAMPDLAEALRVFEIHENQSGVLVFVGDSLASAFVVPSVADYRNLHIALIQDFYGELLYYHGIANPDVGIESVVLDGEGVNNLDDLAAEFQRAREAWANFHLNSAAGLLGKPVMAERTMKMGPYSLFRFITGFEPNRENHLGEIIMDDLGTTAYLKTYRMSSRQLRTVYLLDRLSRHDWHPQRTAAAMGETLKGLIKACDKADLGFMFSQQAREKARRG